MVQNKVFSSVLWSVAKNWGGKFTSLLVFMALTRMLDARAVGAVALVSAILAVLVSLAEMGLAEYLIYREDSERSRSQIFWFQLYVMGGVFLLAMVGGPLVLEASGQHDAAAVFPYLCLVLPISALSSVQDAIQRRNLKFKEIAVRSLIGMLAGGIVGVGMAWAGAGMWSLVGKQLCETAVIAGLLWRMSDWRPRWGNDWSGFRTIFDYGRYLAGGRVVDVLAGNIDDMIVGVAIGQNELGLYSIGKKLYMLSSELLTGVAHQISGPIFASVKQGGAALWSMYVKAVGYSAWLIVPMYTALYPLAPEVVPLLFGDKWSGSVWVLQTFCFVGMLIPLALFHWSMLMASGNAARSFRYSMTRSLGGIAIISCASLGGWKIFVMAQVARQIFNIGVGETFLSRYLPFKRLELWRRLLPAMLTSFAVLLALYLLGEGQHLFVKLGVVGAVLLSSYALMLHTVRRGRLDPKTA